MARAGAFSSLLPIFALTCSSYSGEVTAVGDRSQPLFNGALSAGFSSVVMLDDVCSATVLEPNLVVYAAHCGKDFSTVTTRTGTRVPVARCAWYPEARYHGLDLGYCLLGERLEDVEVILPLAQCEIQELGEGATVTQVGYGPTSAEGAGLSALNQSLAQVTQLGEEITVESDATGPCGGDSGGPLLFKTRSDTWRVAGVLSAGDTYGCEVSASYYTPLWPFLPWIERETGLDVTPCGDAASGEWLPSAECTDQPRAHSSSEGPLVAATFSAACGPPFEPPALDVQEPRVTLSAPAGVCSGAGNMTIGLTAEDEGWGVESVALSLSNDQGERLRKVQSTGPVELSLSGAAPGNWHIDATARDFAGNQARVEQTLTIRDCGESCQLASGPPGSRGSGLGATLAALLVTARRLRVRRRRDKRALSAPLVVGLALLMGCGGQSSSSKATGEGGAGSQVSGGAGSQVSGGAGSQVSGTGGAGPAVPDLANCPSARPALGESCGERLVCTFGDSVRSDCRSTFRCRDGTWSEDENSCPEPPPDYCPAERPTGACVALDYQGRPLIVDGEVVCSYDDGALCYCRFCPGDQCQDEPQWACELPPEDPACPARLPNYGAPCTEPGTLCSYGDPCNAGGTMLCRGTLWYPLFPSCSE